MTGFLADHDLLRGVGPAGLETLRGVLLRREYAALVPDLAILDLAMPGSLSGLDACRALKADPATSAIPGWVSQAGRLPTISPRS